MDGYTYLHLGETVDPDRYVICKYRVTSKLPIEKAADAIAAEQSTGTWTGISTLDPEIIGRLGARVTDISGDVITVGFPVEDFSVEVGSVPQILSVIAGNLFGLGALDGVRLEDVVFPREITSQFKGPKFGAEGIRRMLDRPEKPLVGTIVKPKIGLSPERTAQYVYEAGSGGLTNSKDDETLVDQAFCPIEDRTVMVSEVLDRLEEEGHRMIHAINVSARTDRIVELAERVQSWGARQIMVDVITCGFSAVQALAEDPSIKVPIHVHRTMHGAITKNPLHGVAMLPFTKLVRMCGGDALHIGTLGAGKMSADVHEDSNLGACLGDDVPYRGMMPVCSGGVYPGVVGAIVERSGFNVQIQAGGGVAGHPDGVRGGAMAMCQAVDAAYEGVPVQEYAETHRELRLALEKWGLK
ncbi:MAG: ribulose 1,5-bisphosphate carboxylase large subunit [Candidatus Methanomethylophilaceae archaeon]|nr:ribulose 1,5-bisphosphate carboxylase large subunit [Candidatus Methanomethylophilaceae archaeon]